jgi:protease PrsW
VNCRCRKNSKGGLFDDLDHLNIHYMKIILALIPVLLFLLLLYLLDSFRLVRLKTLAFLFLCGAMAAVIAYFTSSALVGASQMEFETYSKYVAPFIEELLKATVILILIFRKRIGFTIDAAIYGFATGAGFAVFENIYYLVSSPDPNLMIWILRGLGTAIMHSGTTALVAVFAIWALNLEKKIYTGFLPGLTLAILIHSGFNHFYIQPVIQTLLIVILIPSILILMFIISEKQLQNWLEIEFYNEAELLSTMNRGEFSKSKSGQYLTSLKQYFPAEMIVDMYCYVSVYLELSVKSKRNILLAECGLPIIKESGLGEKVTEFRQLRKNIGKSGELALSPLIRLRQRDLWKLTTFSY